MSSGSEETQLRIDGLADIFDISLAPYRGVDFSKLAFLFCGQGQMSRGVMSDIVSSHPIFTRRFSELDELVDKMGLGTPSTYIREVEKKADVDLESLHSSLCLFTLQIAMFETLVSIGRFPRLLSAHSFGEFAQLVASGVMSFPDMVQFLVDRHQCVTSYLNESQARFTMFVVHHPETIDKTIGQVDIGLANINSRHQRVYVCREADFDGLRKDLKSKRIACVKIHLDRPYHTSWLLPVRDRLETVLRGRSFRFRAPTIPFVSSVGAKLFDQKDFDSESVIRLLLDQLISTVDFPSQLGALRQAGIGNFIELSPTDVLESFVQQYFDDQDSAFKMTSFRRKIGAQLEAKRSYDQFKNSKAFLVLDKALKSLTGYSLQQIKLEDRIREDLGIDSIKKAEIVFEIIDNMSQVQLVTPANLADLATFGDIVEYFETSRLAAEKKTLRFASENVVRFSPQTGRWLETTLVDFRSWRSATVRHFRCEALGGDRLFQALKEAQFEELIVLDLRNVEPTDILNVGRSWLNGLKDLGEPGFKRWILLRAEDEIGECLEAALMSYSQEKQIAFKTIDLPHEFELSDEVLLQESLDFVHVKVRYRDGRRFVRKFVEIESGSSGRNKGLEHAPLQPQKVMVFGGLGGIAWEILNGFNNQDLDTLVVFGRSTEDQVDRSRLQQLGRVAKTVAYRQFNAEDEVGVRKQIAECISLYGVFDLYLHSVGVEVSEPLERMTSDVIERILAPKISLARVLYDVARADERVRVIFNSSIVSELGNKGQCPYAFANAYLNALARDSQRILSLCWPGWESIGVAAAEMNALSLKLTGMNLIRPSEAVPIFHRALREGAEGVLFVLDEGAIVDLLTSAQTRHEYLKLMKSASRDQSVYVIPGLTQNQFPYLKDHLIKKACIFPASGSIALMLFTGYFETGRLGSIENFAAHNFHVVGADSSNVLLESVRVTSGRKSIRVRSHHLLAEGDLIFENQQMPRGPHWFQADLLGIKDFEQNAPVYVGPLFELSREAFIETKTGRVLGELDLLKAPVYMKIPVIDKLHRLIEQSFSAVLAKSLLDFGKFVLPKSTERIAVHPESLGGLNFKFLIESLRYESGHYICDILVLTEAGEVVMEFQKHRSIPIGETKSDRSKGFKTRSHQREFWPENRLSASQGSANSET